MKAVNIHGPNDVRVDEVAKPAVGPNDVLLKVEACGICGSDLTFAKLGFQLPGGMPWPLGHEAAGSVIEAGSEVKGVSTGLRAIINPMGAYDNVIGNGGTEGAFADYLLIRNASLGQHLLPMPEGMAAERAALVEPFAVGLHGVNQGKAAAGDKVVVFGAGPIGLSAVFWLKRRGVGSIVSVDLSDARLEIARGMGATDTINPSSVDLIETLQQIHGKDAPVLGHDTAGTDLFIDMAGAPGVLEGAIKAGKFGSRIVVTAVYPAPVPLDLQTLMLKEMSITTAVGYPTELPDVLAALADATDAEVAPYVTHRYSFDRFNEAFDVAKKTTSGKVMVVFN